MKILHLEDNPNDAELVRALILDEWPDCAITCVSNRFGFLSALEHVQYDLILSDFALQALNGLEALKLARERSPDTPFIFLSGTIGEDRAIDALQSGAQDYVLKDRMKRLINAIARALREFEERKRRQEAESRTRDLADFLNQAREAVIVTDLDGQITFWNRGAEMISGWSAAEAVNRKCDSLFDEDVAAALERACVAAMAHGDWSGEVEVHDRTGRPRLVELRLSVIRDDAGRPRARLALGTDITDRRQAEHRIREQADMLNQAREAIFITDLADRMIYWNAGAERLFGWRSDEVINKPIGDLFDPTVPPLREETLTKGEWVGELRLQTRTRHPLIVESRQTLIRDDAGRPKARLSIINDITDRKRLEEQFLRSQRMENIGMLAAGIAHDLNNMLAPIMLAAPMLQDHVTDPVAQGLLTTLEKSAERGANLVRQILSFAHGATGEPRLLQVRHVLREITSVISGTFPKSIRLEEHIPGDLWPIEANPTQIHQVVLNLCVNARDAMLDGGTLRLRAENITLDADGAQAIPGGRPGSFVVLHVEDTGTGVPPDVAAHMWEPFYTTKETGKGTGLGLSTVRGIVESHQGFVEFQTVVGAGSTFRIYVPAAEGAATDGLSPATHPLPPGKGELILIVDDERHIREMIVTMLTRSGYRTMVAADGAEAAVLFAQRASEIRLVITDLQMPNLDGERLGRALRRINSGIKLLVVSGMAVPRLKSEAAVETFADAFLPKPFKPETLRTKVYELLRGPVSAHTNTPWKSAK